MNIGSRGDSTTKSGSGLQGSSYALNQKHSAVLGQPSRASIAEDQYGVDKRQHSYNMPEKIKITTAQPNSRRRLQSQIARN